MKTCGLWLYAFSVSFTLLESEAYDSCSEISWWCSSIKCQAVTLWPVRFQVRRS